ncbi:MAG: DUF4282 domain-containing protein [Litorimonas sp.]
MKNLLNFFFSFDKLFKEKLVVPFFWLALIVFGLAFFAEFLDAIQLDPLAVFVEFINAIASFFLALVSIRIIAELMVAVFRINDNLSPDKGRSELVDIDPMLETRRAAEAAVAGTRNLTKTASEKTRTAVDNVRDQVEDTTDSLTAKAKSVVPGAVKADVAPDASMMDKSVMGEGSVPDAADEPTPVKALEPSAIDGSAVKKRGPGRPKGSTSKPKAEAASATAPAKRGRGRPKGSKNKAKAATGTTASKTKPILDPATGEPVKRGRGRPKGSKNKPKVLGPDGKPVRAKPGPKPGTKLLRDADGNLLKKDGTPRKKPGPKPKPKPKPEGDAS